MKSEVQCNLINRDLNSGEMLLWSKFGSSNFYLWWLIVQANSKWGKFWVWSSIWPWRSRSITPKNNRDLNQVVLHLLTKFGGSSFYAWRVRARTSSGLTDTHTDGQTDGHTDRQTQATTIPEGQNWPRVKIKLLFGVALYEVYLILLAEQHKHIFNLIGNFKGTFCLARSKVDCQSPCQIWA